MISIDELEKHREKLIVKVNEIDETKRSINASLSKVRSGHKKPDWVVKAEFKYRQLTDTRANLIIKLGQIKKQIKTLRKTDLTKALEREQGYLSVFDILNKCPRDIMRDLKCDTDRPCKGDVKKNNLKHCWKKHGVKIGSVLNEVIYK